MNEITNLFEKQNKLTRETANLKNDEINKIVHWATQQQQTP